MYKHKQVSEVFRQAERDKTPQIKHLTHDGKGGYCAIGLLETHYAYWDSDREEMEELLPKDPTNHLRPFAYCNDVLNWSWTNFAEFAEKNMSKLRWEQHTNG